MRRLMPMPHSLPDDDGSLTIEAALVLPLILLYTAYLFLLSLSLRADMLWQEAARSAVNEVSLMTAFYRSSDLDSDFSLKNIAEIPENLKKVFYEGISSAVLQERQKYWYKESCKNEAVLLNFIAEPYAYLSNQDGMLFYSFSYRKILDPKESRKSSLLPVPYWGGSELLNKIDKKESGLKQDDSIWSENSLIRGQYFRETSDSGLPYHFPVIASFEDGEAKSLKSMDLTAPSYQNENNLRRQLDKHVSALEGFCGVENWGKGDITIREDEIRSRRLSLIIPENTPEHLMQLLSDEKTRLAGRGIKLDWSMRGRSEKYQKHENHEE